MKSILGIGLLALMGAKPATTAPKPAVDVAVVARPATAHRNAYYASNQAPLQPEFLVKLPVGSVRPDGWLRQVLTRQADGLAGHLGEISAWLTKADNAWLSPAGTGKYGWEEVPYWLKGYASMAYLLNRPQMQAEAKTWLEGTIKSQRPDGDFGPVVYKKQKRDLWAQMLMLFCLQTYHEHSQDPRVITLMTNYFRWQNTLPDDQFLEDYWENSRGGDNLYSVYWLYNRTRAPFLLALAEKIHRNTANWKQAGAGILPNWHNVNIAECFREPATYYLQSHDPADLRATYQNFDLVRQRYGQVPGGMWGGDENSRPGYTDPRQAVETCGMVEQMASDELLMRFTGDPHWAENCEDVAFNTLPAAFMPDYRSLRYLTAPNMVASDARNHSPGINNEGPFLMMNPFSSRCCQHNHSNGWAYFAENLWLATPDNGLAAVLYSASAVTAKVGTGQEVTLIEKTEYPFGETVRLTVQTARPVRFPLYLRLPAWCARPVVRLNGHPVAVARRPGRYLRLTTTWKAGDQVALEFPMHLAVRTWAENKNSVSVNYGPLTYSLRMGEAYQKSDSKQTAIGDSGWQPTADPSQWAAFEIHPQQPWNYGLVLNAAHPEQAFRLVRRVVPAGASPFTPEGMPLVLEAPARRVAGWGVDQYGLCGLLPQSPVASAAPLETVTLLPMGAARLRISAFPVVQ